MLVDVGCPRHGGVHLPPEQANLRALQPSGVSTSRIQIGTALAASDERSGAERGDLDRFVVALSGRDQVRTESNARPVERRN